MQFNKMLSGAAVLYEMGHDQPWENWVQDRFLSLLL